MIFNPKTQLSTRENVRYWYPKFCALINNYSPNTHETTLSISASIQERINLFKEIKQVREARAETSDQPTPLKSTLLVNNDLEVCLADMLEYADDLFLDIVTDQAGFSGVQYCFATAYLTLQKALKKLDLQRLPNEDNILSHLEKLMVASIIVGMKYSFEDSIPSTSSDKFETKEIVVRLDDFYLDEFKVETIDVLIDYEYLLLDVIEYQLPSQTETIATLINLQRLYSIERQNTSHNAVITGSSNCDGVQFFNQSKELVSQPTAPLLAKRYFMDYVDDEENADDACSVQRVRSCCF